MWHSRPRLRDSSAMNICHNLSRLVLAATAALLMCSGLRAQVKDVLAKPAIHTEYFAHPDDAKKRIEVFWAKPATQTPSPAIVFLHGHQEPERPGARVYVDMGTLEQMAAAGYVAIAISQPGYGGSDGPPDFCGPYTQHAVLRVIREFRKRALVRPNEMAVQGVSRGANVAAMVAAQDDKLAAVILVAGLYDLGKLFAMAERSPLVKRIVDNVRSETHGADEQVIRERSALLFADRIKAATLILNGAQDDRTDPEVARQLGAKIAAHGTPAEVVIYPDYGHSIPPPERAKVIAPFLARYLKP